MAYFKVQSTGHEKIPARGWQLLIWCKGNDYHQVDQRAAIGGKYDPLESYITKNRLKTSSS